MSTVVVQQNTENGTIVEVTLSTDPYNEVGTMTMMAKAYVSQFVIPDVQYPEYFLNKSVVHDLCKTYVPINKTVELGSSTSGDLGDTSIDNPLISQSYSTAPPSSSVSVSGSVYTSGY